VEESISIYLVENSSQGYVDAIRITQDTKRKHF